MTARAWMGGKRNPDGRERRRRRLDWLLGGLGLAAFALVLVLAAALKPPRNDVRGAEAAGVLPWSELQPSQAGERPAGSVDLAGLQDSDPRAAALLREMRAAADRAPGVAAMDGRQVALAGYVVPLDGDRRGSAEFLLVPYFGACIHTPPPPANQVVHVRSTAPRPLRTMDQVVVRGVLHVVHAEFGPGASAYRLDAADIEAP